jgi:hypothetical protein
MSPENSLPEVLKGRLYAVAAPHSPPSVIKMQALIGQNGG